MTNEDFYDDEEFIIKLTIIGTEYEEVEVKITDPNKTIRDQISSIVQLFELPKMENDGTPILYKLGQMLEDSDEPEVFDSENEDGREMCLLDYCVKPGDDLELIAIPIAYACPVPIEMEHKWQQYCLHNK